MYSKPINGPRYYTHGILICGKESVYTRMDIRLESHVKEAPSLRFHFTMVVDD